MIRGTFTGQLEAVVGLRVHGPTGTELDLDAVIDTGFNASLTLPDSAARALGLVRRSRGKAALADGTVRYYSLYAAEVEWDGRWLPITVSAVGDEVLLGMGLLAGHRLTIDAVPGGLVEITPLP